MMSTKKYEAELITTSPTIYFKRLSPDELFSISLYQLPYFCQYIYCFLERAVLLLGQKKRLRTNPKVHFNNIFSLHKSKPIPLKVAIVKPLQTLGFKNYTSLKIACNRFLFSLRLLSLMR